MIIDNVQNILDHSFYNRFTVDVAKDLLGCILYNKTEEGITKGKIVEVEAYVQNDPASHSYNGKTSRNKIMFGPAGHAYVYFIYGMYHCFNIVTREEGIGEGVMLRALEPLEGLDLMKKRRRTNDLYNLCSGPAKLVQALDIKANYNGKNITKGNFIICNKSNEKIDIVETTRIGIKKGCELPLRFYIKGNSFISKI
jgi:DNA-3-methyladenine glycosylase